MTKIKPRLSYANVVSTLALFLVLSGGIAWAAKSIGTNQLKGSAVTAAKIKNGAVVTSKLRNEAVNGEKLANAAVGTAKLADGAVTGAKLGNEAVATGNIANGAITGEKVKTATLGEVPAANSANPGVFAKIGPSGAVEAINSKGLNTLDVSKPATGVYCVTVSAFIPRGGQVTPQAVGSTAMGATIVIGGTGSCAAPAVQVQTFAAGALTDAWFYIELYR